MSMSEARCVMERMNGDSVRINSCFCSLDVATFTVSLFVISHCMSHEWIQHQLSIEVVKYQYSYSITFDTKQGHGSSDRTLGR